MSRFFMNLIPSLSEGSAGLGLGHCATEILQRAAVSSFSHGFSCRLCSRLVLKHKSVTCLRISGTRTILTFLLSPLWPPIGNKWEMCTFQRAVLGTLCLEQRAFFYFIMELSLRGEQISNENCSEVIETWCSCYEFIWKPEQTKLCPGWLDS